MDQLQFQQIDFGTPLFDQCLDLRNRLLRIPLNLTFRAKDISMEWDQLHFALLDLHLRPIACLTLRPIGEQKVHMRQVAVETLYQNKGIGQHLVYETEQWCRENNISIIILHARKAAVPFYQKLNYTVTSDEYIEVGIAHFDMEKMF